MRIADGGNLRQMGHADDLTAAGNIEHLLADHLRHASGHAGIDLIEHHSVDAAGIHADGFERQHNSRQFAARGNLCQRHQRFAGIRRNHEHNAIRAAGRGPLFRTNVDLKARSGHAQILQFVHDALLQPGCQHLAGCRQFRAGIDQFCLGNLLLRAQFGQALIAAFNAVQLALGLLIKYQYVRNFRTVLALQFVDQVQAIADALRFRRVITGLIQQRLQFIAQILRRIIQFGRAVRHGFKARIDGGNALELFGGIIQQFLCALAASAAVVHCVVRALQGTCNALRIFDQAHLRLEVLFLAGPKFCRTNLVDLEAQHIGHAGLLCGVHREGVDLIGNGSMLPVFFRHTLQQRSVRLAAVPVQEIQRHAGIHQKLMLMLSVQVHHQNGELLERLQRNRQSGNALQVSAAAAEFSLHDHKAILIIRTQRIEEGLGSFIIANVEHGADRRFLFSVPDQRLVCAAAQRQFHGVHHNGLARSGLTGQHVQPRFKRDGQPLDQCDVADAHFD